MFVSYVRLFAFAKPPNTFFVSLKRKHLISQNHSIYSKQTPVFHFFRLDGLGLIEAIES